MRSSPPVMTFRRDLIGPRLEALNALLGRLATIQLTNGSDEFRWTLNENGRFSVDSMYRALIQYGVPVEKYEKFWKMKIPLKSKIFSWYARRGVILTKDNLVKRN